MITSRFFPASLVRVLTRSCIAALLLAMAGCAGWPIQEMSDARQAIQEARQIGVNQQKSPSLQQAESLLHDAEQNIKQGHYKRARKQARAAREEAIKARAAVLGEGSVAK